MAIANRTAPTGGVKPGYTPKAKRVTRDERTALRRATTSLYGAAREIVAFARDEIVYATMDTLRLLGYLRYEFGFRARVHVEPVVHELEHLVHDHELIHDAGAFAAEQARGLAKR